MRGGITADYKVHIVSSVSFAWNYSGVLWYVARDFRACHVCLRSYPEPVLRTVEHALLVCTLGSCTLPILH